MSYGGKGFTEIHTFDLGKSLCHQPCLVANDNPIRILLVLKYPLGANDSLAIFWPRHQLPNFIALEVVEFFMNGLEPILIFKRFIYFLGLDEGDKGMVGTKSCQLASSDDLVPHTSKDLVQSMFFELEITCLPHCPSCLQLLQRFLRDSLIIAFIIR